MNVNLAEHYGMCFGVRDALRLTHDLAASGPVTVLGQLVHNPAVDDHLKTLGVRRAELELPGESYTERVVITAHGAADSARRAWQDAGFQVADTTCPLVRKAHRALECLVLAGYHPVVIGQKDHAEVRGLVTDFPDTSVVLEADDLTSIPARARIGVVSQTTQPMYQVETLLEQLREHHPTAEVKYINTVCRPTRDRQEALEKLCRENDTIVVVGGRNSNNTRQLVLRAIGLGCRAWQVESVLDLQVDWFRRTKNVGVTAGTSTLDETVRDVFERLKQIAAGRKRGLLRAVA